MLISEEYRDLNRRLHEAEPEYGANAHKWVPVIKEVVAGCEAKTLLDYGCGKGTLGRALDEAYGGDLEVREYDPAMPGLEAAPEPADLVFCGDVLEHIEPRCLDEVLEDLHRVTLKAVILTVCIVEAKKTLPDGRNAHLIVADERWWLPKILKWFQIDQMNNLGKTLLIIARPRHA